MHISVNTQDLTNDASLPQLYRVRQLWNTQPVTNIPALVRQQLDDAGIRARLAPGMRVAVTAGSRGITDIVPILRASVDWLREAGAEPFVVPAMGSHGGATAPGQVKLLARLGVTEESMGCPIHATMDVVELGRIADGTPVYMDRYAAEADGVLVVNRLKTHTSFEGSIESGLAKMCAVGLGKRQGAEIVHWRGVYGLANQMTPMARVVVERGKILGGLAILEDAHDQTADLVGLPPEDIGGAGEATLLERSKRMMARLPFKTMEVLVVDEIGKNYSGTGMDTNIIGRLPIPGEAQPTSPLIYVIVVLDLSEATAGNANGMGLADITTAKLASKINFHDTYVNVLTAGLVGLCKGGMPIVLPTARDAIATALKVCGQPEQDQIRLVRIPNTLHLEELLVSAALLPEVEANPNLELLGPAEWYGVVE